MPGGRGGGGGRGRGRGGRGGGGGEKPAKPAPVEKAPLGSQAAPKEVVGMAVGGTETSTFEDCPYISNHIKAAIAENFKFERMSRVQHCTVPVASQGRDLVAKAQTGTGKTMAFCIPSIDILLQNPLPKDIMNGPAANYPARCLVLSPTRELACQIATEAEGLVKTKATGGKSILNVAVFYGGRPINKDLGVIKSTKLDMIVATPGRLLDHFKTTDNFAQRLSKLRIFVLDEADQMLDMGFRHDLDKIMSFLPHPDSRQTLLFSATIPSEIINFAPTVLRQDFSIVTTTKEGPMTEPIHSSPDMPNPLETIRDDPLATASLVEQAYGIVPTDALFAHLVHQVQHEMTENREAFKIMCFLPTARMAGLANEILNKSKIASSEIHSRVSQAKRTKASDAFKACTTGIICCSDVTARGMDYPNVSLVLQVGLPSDQSQYVHRLGRTARAGRKGRGLLLLTPDEEFFVQQLLTKGKLPVKKADIPDSVDIDGFNKAMSKIDEVTRCQAYQAWLGFYNGFSGRLKWSKEQLVANANGFALGPLGLHAVPPLMKKTIGMMGLKGVKGLVIDGEGKGQGWTNMRKGPQDNAPAAAAAPAPSAGRGGRGGRGGAHHHHDPQSNKGVEAARRDQFFEKRTRDFPARGDNHQPGPNRGERGGRGGGRNQDFHHHQHDRGFGQAASSHHEQRGGNHNDLLSRLGIGQQGNSGNRQGGGRHEGAPRQSGGAPRVRF